MISMVISRKESKRGDLLAIRVHFGSLQRFREPKTAAAAEVVISQSAETRAPATTSAAAEAAARPNMQIVAVDAAAAK